MPLRKKKECYIIYYIWAWLLFDYFLPLLIVLLPISVAVLVDVIPYSFEEILSSQAIFSSVNLIPIAALVMIGTIREMKMEIKLEGIQNDFKLSLIGMIGSFAVIILILVYGMLTFFAINKSMNQTPQSLENELPGLYITILSLIIILLAGCYSYSYKWIFISSFYNKT